MHYETLHLEDFFPALPAWERKTELTLYMRTPIEGDGKKSPCVLVLPGGGYGFTSDREAEPIALAFLGRGINAAVLRYAVAPARYPTQLLQACAALSLLAAHGEDWAIDTSRLFVMGFSAGGHLAANLGTAWHEPWVREALGLPGAMPRPRGMLLCYPVITSGPYTHKGSMENLLGPDPDPALVALASLENQVSSHTPEAFLWHTSDDGAVPCENSLFMATALRKENIPFELHIYPSGVHGLSLCNETTATMGQEATHVRPYLANWFYHGVEWIKTRE